MYSRDSARENITMADCQTSGSDTNFLRASACAIEKEYEWVVSVVIGNTLIPKAAPTVKTTS